MKRFLPVLLILCLISACTPSIEYAGLTLYTPPPSEEEPSSSPDPIDPFSAGNIIVSIPILERFDLSTEPESMLVNMIPEPVTEDEAADTATVEGETDTVAVSPHIGEEPSAEAEGGDVMAEDAVEETYPFLISIKPNEWFQTIKGFEGLSTDEADTESSTDEINPFETFFAEVKTGIDALNSGEQSFDTSGYALSHFADYIKPGAVHVASESAEGIYAVSCLNPDLTLAVIVLNDGNEDVPLQLDIEGSFIDIPLPAGSVASLLIILAQ